MNPLPEPPPALDLPRLKYQWCDRLTPLNPYDSLDIAGLAARGASRNYGFSVFSDRRSFQLEAGTEV